MDGIVDAVRIFGNRCRDRLLGVVCYQGACFRKNPYATGQFAFLPVGTGTETGDNGTSDCRVVGRSDGDAVAHGGQERSDRCMAKGFAAGYAESFCGQYFAGSERDGTRQTGSCRCGGTGFVSDDSWQARIGKRKSRQQQGLR